MSKDSPVQTRDEIVDMLKGVGIISVIVGHSTIINAEVTGKIMLYIYAFHMPLFFLVSGFFLKSSNSLYAIPGELLKILKRIYLPFFIASIFYVFIAPIGLNYPNYAEGASKLIPKDYDISERITAFFQSIGISSLATIRGTGLWFLVALFVARIYWILIFWIFKVPFNKVTVAIITVITIIFYYTNIKNQLIVPNNVRFMVHVAWFGFNFMCIGKLLWEKHKNKQFSILEGVIFGIFGFILARYNGTIDTASFSFRNVFVTFISSLLIISFVYVMCQVLSEKTEYIKRILIWAGKHSIQLLIVHPFILLFTIYYSSAVQKIGDAQYSLNVKVCSWILVFLTVFVYVGIKNILKQRIIKIAP